MAGPKVMPIAFAPGERHQERRVPTDHTDLTALKPLGRSGLVGAYERRPAQDGATSPTGSLDYSAVVEFTTNKYGNASLLLRVELRCFGRAGVPKRS